MLRHAVGHVGGDGAHLRCAFHVKHLIVKVDVRPDFLQHGALGRSGQEQGLVDLQAPGPESFQRPDTGAGCAASSNQEGSDGAVQTLTFSVELLLKLPQRLQETFQRTLSKQIATDIIIRSRAADALPQSNPLNDHDFIVMSHSAKLAANL